MVGLDACVYDQATLAAPVLFMPECLDAVNIGGGIGARESDPKEIG
jgi:hypothetical protein